MSHLAHLCATSDCAPRSQAVGTPLGGRRYVATLPTCGPPLILPPWATSDSAPCSKAAGTPRGGRGYVATLPTCGPLLILPPALKRWGPPYAAGVM